MVQEFYATILLVANVEDSSIEVTVHYIQVTYSLDELARFLGYERDLAVFPNLLLSKEGRPTEVEVFQKMLGEDTAIIERSNMQHEQLLPFWQIMYLIQYFAINPKKHTTKLSYHRAEFLYLVVVWGEPVDMASYIL